MFYLYTLPYCIYSQNAIQLLKKLKLPHRNIVVSKKDKAKYKRTHQMETFPQIFFESRQGQIMKIGGYDDLVTLLDLLKECKS